MESQCKRILAYIDAYGAITSLDAVRDLGCHRLAARIADLRKAGYEIESRMVSVEDRYGEKCRVSEYKILKPQNEGV